MNAMSWERVAQRVNADRPLPHERPKKKPVPTEPEKTKKASPFEWETAERWFVDGYEEVNEHGEHVHVWPIMKQVAVRLGCSQQSVAYKAQQGNWLERQRLSQIKAKLEWQQEEARRDIRENGDPRTRPIKEPTELLEQAVRKFQESFDKGRIRTDTIGDFERLVKLRHWLEEQQATRKGTEGELSLEQLQARHAAQRKAEVLALENDDVSGVTFHGEEHEDDGEGEEADPMAPTKTKAHAPRMADSAESPQVTPLAAVKPSKKAHGKGKP